MDPLVIGLMLGLVTVVAVVFFAIGKSRRTQSQAPQSQAPQSQTPQSQTPQSQAQDLTALRKQRIDDARQKRMDLERLVAEEESLLREKEDCEFLKQELKDIRSARKGQPKP